MRGSFKMCVERMGFGIRAGKSAMQFYSLGIQGQGCLLPFHLEHFYWLRFHRSQEAACF